MKIFRTLLSLFLLVVLHGCIQSEDPNAEADIESCEVTFTGKSEVESAVIGDRYIQIMVDVIESPITSLKKFKITPKFTATKGATIYILNGEEEKLYPEEGIELIFTFNTKQKFKVISEDGDYTKIYQMYITDSELPLRYTFNDVELIKKISNTYYDFIYGSKPDMRWASGNPGYSLTGINKKPQNFPTTQVDEGKDGKCVKLTTLSTGPFGKDQDMPIAAGNLFLGYFDVANALTNALKATQFGRKFRKQPLRIEGYYKYQSGEKDIENKPFKDIGDIYAVFYEAGDDNVTINGSDKFTNPNIVAIARIGDRNEPMIEVKTWTKFSIEFDYKKTINTNKLQEGKYKLAIVCSSSIRGDEFIGAINSTLWIDEIKIIVK